MSSNQLSQWLNKSWLILILVGLQNALAVTEIDREETRLHCRIILENVATAIANQEGDSEFDKPFALALFDTLKNLEAAPSHFETPTIYRQLIMQNKLSTAVHVAREKFLEENYILSVRAHAGNETGYFILARKKADSGLQVFWSAYDPFSPLDSNAEGGHWARHQAAVYFSQWAEKSINAKQAPKITFHKEAHFLSMDVPKRKEDSLRAYFGIPSREVEDRDLATEKSQAAVIAEASSFMKDRDAALTTVMESVLQGMIKQYGNPILLEKIKSGLNDTSLGSLYFRIRSILVESRRNIAKENYFLPRNILGILPSENGYYVLGEDEAAKPRRIIYIPYFHDFTVFFGGEITGESRRIATQAETEISNLFPELSFPRLEAKHSHWATGRLEIEIPSPLPSSIAKRFSLPTEEMASKITTMQTAQKDRLWKIEIGHLSMHAALQAEREAAAQKTYARVKGEIEHARHLIELSPAPHTFGLIARNTLVNLAANQSVIPSLYSHLGPQKDFETTQATMDYVMFVKTSSQGMTMEKVPGKTDEYHMVPHPRMQRGPLDSIVRESFWERVINNQRIRGIQVYSLLKEFESMDLEFERWIHNKDKVAHWERGYAHALDTHLEFSENSPLLQRDYRNHKREDDILWHNGFLRGLYERRKIEEETRPKNNPLAKLRRPRTPFEAIQKIGQIMLYEIRDGFAFYCVKEDEDVYRFGSLRVDWDNLPFWMLSIDTEIAQGSVTTKTELMRKLNREYYAHSKQNGWKENRSLSLIHESYPDAVQRLHQSLLISF